MWSLRLLLGSSLLFAACGERLPCPDEVGVDGLAARIDVALGMCNRAPRITVSGSRQAPKGTTVQLDARRALDPNGDVLRYRWALESRPPASTTELVGATTAQVSFLVDQVGVFVLRLEVSDGELTTKSDRIIVTSTNDPPIAAAGDDFSVAVGARVRLDGSASRDVNGDDLAFAWSILRQPGASALALDERSAVVDGISPQTRGEYEFLLTVSDGELMGTDSVLVRVGISANIPVAVAESRTATVALDETVRLDGRRSSDADGDTLTYAWAVAARPPNSLAELDDRAAATPTFVPDQPGAYRLELVVSDGYHFSEASSVTVTAFGEPRVRCENTIPFAASATLSGTTVGAGDDYETGCGLAGQEDVVLEYIAPGELDSLDIELIAGFDAVLAVYVNDCGAASRRACLTGRQAAVSLGRVRAGDRVAIIVDGGGAGGQGTYQVALTGRLASAQPCEIGSTSFTCDLGVCAPTASGPRCPAILDCVDGVDVDNDGLLDEDVCTNPPTLTCPADMRVEVLGVTQITATQSSTTPVIRRRWTVEDEPLGSSLTPTPRDRPATSVRPLLYGDYRLRYSEIDERLQASSCETVLAAGTQDALRVELIWNPTIPEDLHASDVDLHLLHPSATSWWNDLDCYFGNSRPDWDMPGVDSDNPRLDLDDTSGRGPENINILAPAAGQSYRLGVHYFSDHGFGSSAVYVNVYCYSQLVQRFGPVTMRNDEFWKIADITVDAAACRVAPLGSANAPLVVTEDDSRANR
jgi:hypothetical protein